MDKNMQKNGIHSEAHRKIKIYSRWCDVMCDAYLMYAAQMYRYGFYMHASNDYDSRFASTSCLYTLSLPNFFRFYPVDVCVLII